MNFSGRDFSKPSPDYLASVKLCPFMKAPCSRECMLYRDIAENAGFQCPFQELIAISFALRTHFNTPRKYPNKQ